MSCLLCRLGDRRSGFITTRFRQDGVVYVVHKTAKAEGGWRTQVHELEATA